LFAGFLMLAVGWMTLAAVAGASSAQGELPDAAVLAE